MTKGKTCGNCKHHKREIAKGYSVKTEKWTCLAKTPKWCDKQNACIKWQPKNENLS